MSTDEYPGQIVGQVELLRIIAKVTIIAPAVAQLLGGGVVAGVLGLHQEAAWNKKINKIKLL